MENEISRENGEVLMIFWVKKKFKKRFDKNDTAAPRLEWSSFCGAAERRRKKAGTEDGKGAQKKIPEKIQGIFIN